MSIGAFQMYGAYLTQYTSWKGHGKAITFPSVKNDAYAGLQILLEREYSKQRKDYNKTDNNHSGLHIFTFNHEFNFLHNLIF